MAKGLTKRIRRSIYLNLAKEIEKANTKNTFGLCLDLRDRFVHKHGGKWFYFGETPEHFIEYGLINPRHKTHRNDNERIIALLFAYQMTF